MEDMKRGLFFAFEGIDGSGKGTQIRKLKKHLEQESTRVFCTAEPNDSPIGDLIHQIMIGRIQTTNDVIAALFVADRLDHIRNGTNGILHFLENGVHVITDRYYFSSYAYQSVDLMTKELFEQKERLVETRKRYFESFALLKDEERVLIIDGNRDEDEVAEDIWKNLSPLL